MVAPQQDELEVQYIQSVIEETPLQKKRATRSLDKLSIIFAVFAFVFTALSSSLTSDIICKHSPEQLSVYCYGYFRAVNDAQLEIFDKLQVMEVNVRDGMTKLQMEQASILTSANEFYLGMQAAYDKRATEVSKTITKIVTESQSDFKALLKSNALAELFLRLKSAVDDIILSVNAKIRRFSDETEKVLFTLQLAFTDITSKLKATAADIKHTCERKIGEAQGKFTLLASNFAQLAESRVQEMDTAGQSYVKALDVIKLKAVEVTTESFQAASSMVLRASGTLRRLKGEYAEVLHHMKSRFMTKLNEKFKALSSIIRELLPKFSRQYVTATASNGISSNLTAENVVTEIEVEIKVFDVDSDWVPIDETAEHIDETEVKEPIEAKEHTKVDTSVAEVNEVKKYELIAFAKDTFDYYVKHFGNEMTIFGTWTIVMGMLRAII
jgi:hypothetical protein